MYGTIWHLEEYLVYNNLKRGGLVIFLGENNHAFHFIAVRICKTNFQNKIQGLMHRTLTEKSCKILCKIKLKNGSYDELALEISLELRVRVRLFDHFRTTIFLFSQYSSIVLKYIKNLFITSCQCLYKSLNSYQKKRTSLLDFTKEAEGGKERRGYECRYSRCTD